MDCPNRYCFYVSTGPPAPSSVNVSMVMINGSAGLSVSWELGQAVHGSIYYHAISDQGLTCNSSSSPCVLSGVSCGDMHTIQVVAANEAGPSQPSSPVPFITCTKKPFHIPSVTRETTLETQYTIAIRILRSGSHNNEKRSRNDVTRKNATLATASLRKTTVSCSFFGSVLSQIGSIWNALFVTMKHPMVILQLLQNEKNIQHVRLDFPAE